MTKEDALKIAQEYIDNSPNIAATLTGRAQYMNEWVLDAFWIVALEWGGPQWKKNGVIDGI